MNAQHNKLSRAGFTLIEAMVAVVVMGILAAMTIPSFARYLQQQRVQGTSTELAADIQWARSMAITRGVTLQINFAANEYQVVQPGPNVVVRTRTAPDGITFAASTNPSFYAWGLADAAAISVNGGSQNRSMNLLPNGAVTHYAE